MMDFRHFIRGRGGDWYRFFSSSMGSSFKFLGRSVRKSWWFWLNFDSILGSINLPMLSKCFTGPESSSDKSFLYVVQCSTSLHRFFDFGALMSLSRQAEEDYKNGTMVASTSVCSANGTGASTSVGEGGIVGWTGFWGGIVGWTGWGIVGWTGWGIVGWTGCGLPHRLIHKCPYQRTFSAFYHTLHNYGRCGLLST